MKVIFKIDSQISDDRTEAIEMLNGWKYKACLQEVDNMLRNEIKHGEEELTDRMYNFLDSIRETIAEVICE